MGTSKHVAILLTAALTGILMAGQDQSTASPQAAPRGPSNTRFASCIVRITVDPAIMPLSLGNIESLLQSSGVAVKAGREVLSLNEMQVFNLPLFKVEWLNASSAPKLSAARPSRQTGTDEEMARQMEEVYGPAYAQQMMGSPNPETKGEAKDGEASGPSQKGGSSDREGRSDTAAMGAGGAVNVIGRRAAQAQGQSPVVRRAPGESDVAYRTRMAQIRSQQKALQEMESQGAGGMGGGMMGGYGGMGFYYGVPGAAQQDAGAMQSATIELLVDLPDTVPALADEFLKGVVRNLQDSLSRAHEAYRGDLQGWLDRARDQRRAAQAALDGMPEDAAILQDVQRRLNTVVDLLALNPKMPLADAVDLLKKSVDPPLNIVVLWNNLADLVRVEPTTPVNLDAMSRVRLGTALDLLVKGIPNPLGPGGPTWRIKDNVIVIGTPMALAETRDSGAKPKVETDAMSLVGQRSELTRRMQALELDLAGMDARRKAIQLQIAAASQEGNKRLAADTVTRELEGLLRTSENNLAQLKQAAAAGRVAVAELAQGEESVAKAKIDLARRREELSRQAGGAQLEEFTKDLSRLAIDKAEKEAQLQIVRKQLDEVQKQLAQAMTFDPEAARLRLAQETLDITARRLAELQTCLANLQPPMVMVIGAN